MQSKHFISLTMILLLALFVRTHRLTELMSFVGDQAWYYLSARDAILHGNVPLVGITASRTWLHQGALWTYLLIPILGMAKFHPVAPALFTSVLGVMTVGCVYAVARRFFNERTGLVAAFLYATSPLVIVNDRLPYHTTLTPIITLGILYVLYKLIHETDHGRKKYMPLLVISLVLMYLANLGGIIMVYVVVSFIATGFFLHEKWARVFLNKKLILQSAVMAGILLIPTILYDVSHGFPQTVKFVSWMISRPFLVFVKQSTTSSWGDVIAFLGATLQKIIFYPSVWIAMVVFIGSGALLTRSFHWRSYKKPINMLTIFTGLTLLGVLINKTASNAYTQVLFPGVIILLAYVLANYIKGTMLWFILALLAFVNVYSLMGDNYGVMIPMKERLAKASEIAKEKSGYIIGGDGPGSEFRSFTMNTEYLTWWLGNGPATGSAQVIYIMSEKDVQLSVYRTVQK